MTLRDDVISHERAEAQNIIIVRYWANTRLERLFQAAEQEDMEDRRIELEAKNEALLANSPPQLTIDAPPYSPTTSTALIKLPVVSLGELDQALNQIKESPRDMIRVSDSVINPLLDRWTRWHEIRPSSANNSSTGSTRFAPSVHDLYESDEDKPRGGFTYDEESAENGNGHGHGFYLEGTTTDWRKPHSAEAKREAARLRKQYSGYQPSVDSETEDHYGVKPPPKGRAPTRHVIDSSSSSNSSTDSEYKKPRQRRRRRSSGSISEKKYASDASGRHQSGSSRDSANLARYASSPSTAGSTPRTSIGSPYSPHMHRPHFVHSASSPLPPLHTGNAPNPYQHPGAMTPIGQPYGAQYVPQRYIPPHSQRLPPPRPPSSDGKHRSPSRLASSSHSSHHLSEEEEKRQARLRQQRNLRKGATRGKTCFRYTQRLIY